MHVYSPAVSIAATLRHWPTAVVDSFLRDFIPLDEHRSATSMKTPCFSFNWVNPKDDREKKSDEQPYPEATQESGEKYQGGLIHGRVADEPLDAGERDA